MSLQAVVHLEIIEIQSCLWMGLFKTFSSALALVPKPELKPLGNRYLGPSQLQPAGWHPSLLQLPSAQIRFGDGHGNSVCWETSCQSLTSIGEIYSRKAPVS